MIAPVIYIFFNRPDMVRRTFPAIRAQRPRQLYLIADGPRAHKPADADRCRETRAAVESMLDWDCEITRDYSDVNLGSGQRIASGLTSALAKLGEGMIIEDDILPHPDFFRFCTEALARYRDTPQIHGISAYNPIGRYFPSRHRAVPANTHITWGWATWHRAWSAYRGQLQGWSSPDVKAGIRDHLRDPLYFDEIVRAMRTVENREVDAWDYQWVYTMLYERRQAIVSSVNLIDNLGFTADATHTFHVPAFADGLKACPSSTAPWPALDAPADRLFDRLHWQVYLDGSKKKIALLRALARHSRWLTAKVLKHHD